MVKKVKEVVSQETPESKIAEISKEIIKVEKEANAIVVKTEEDYKKASVFLSSVVKPRVNRINELVKFFTDPFVEARRVALAHKNEIEALFEPKVSALSVIENNIKKAMGGYLREEEEKARKEEARLQKIRDDANAKREEKGQEAIAEPVKSVERTDTMIKTVEGGKTVAKKVWKFEVVSRAHVYSDKEFLARLHNYCIENEITDKILRKMVSDGVRQVEGVRIYEDFDISSSASK